MESENQFIKNDFNPFLDEEEESVEQEISSKKPLTRDDLPPHTPDYAVARMLRTKEEEAALKARVLAGENIPGRKKHTRKVYKRNELGLQDFKLMAFLAHSRIATTKQIASVLGVKQDSAGKRLRGLAEWKYIYKSADALFGRVIWSLTGKGLSIVRDLNELHKLEGAVRVKPAPQTVLHSIAMTQFVVNRCYQDVPEIRDLGVFTIDEVMSETVLQRVWGQVQKEDKHVPMSQRLRWYKQKAKNALKAGEHTIAQWLEAFPGLFILNSTAFEETHRPDFIINRESSRVGAAPVSIAVEVELTIKSPAEYRRILSLYRDDKIAFAKVVYISPDRKIAERVAEIADEIGLPGDKILFGALYDENGNLVQGPINKL